MSGGTGGGGQYIAFALGTVNKMQDADLYYCDGDAIHSAVITTVHNPPTYLSLEVLLNMQIIVFYVFHHFFSTEYFRKKLVHCLHLIDLGLPDHFAIN